jgi:hypothetical protein
VQGDEGEVIVHKNDPTIARETLPKKQPPSPGNDAATRGQELYLHQGATFSVHLDVEADWGGKPIRAQRITLAPRIEAEASEAEILDLITSTDRMAEIPNSLRLGTPVTLRDPQAITTYT